MTTLVKRLPLAFMVASGVGTALLMWEHRNSGRTWTSETLALKLAEIGYKSAWVGPEQYDSYAQGLYVARQSDQRSWDEIAARRPRVSPERLWRGLVLILRDTLDPAPAGYSERMSPGEMRIGELLFFGDSGELDRIAAHLQGREQTAGTDP
jgi:hypothetical protein